ncbi:hypothetical protein R1flu_012820 [Riccia fluitans]|uniref:Uncharacterized protein n=1 Tax=Riccia fluitans TaxID=41844 RepID=A0ABD1ZBY6_9MARC
MTKQPFNTIKLSDDEPQEEKREEESLLAEDTSSIPEADEIEKFRLSMVYSKRVVTPVLQILEDNRALVEEETGWRMTLPGIALHLNKENKIEEMHQLRMEAQKATQDKLKAKEEVARVKL